MMMFRYPWLLLLLAVVPLATWWRYGRRTGRGTVGFSSGKALAGLPVSPWVRARWVLPALFAVGMGLLVLALARPQKGFQESRVETEGVDIVLLADTSTSMREKDLGGGKDRLEAAKEVRGKFIERRPDDRSGLVA
ncbi:MAG: BatA domain-containing protein, partial [Kiritimatiellae bacterium]|nr:BatA domain-containing protein [Kiritimatiellia bacterium]